MGTRSCRWAPSRGQDEAAGGTHRIQAEAWRVSTISLTRRCRWTHDTLRGSSGYSPTRTLPSYPGFCSWIFVRLLRPQPVDSSPRVVVGRYVRRCASKKAAISLNASAVSGTKAQGIEHDLCPRTPATSRSQSESLRVVWVGSLSEGPVCRSRTCEGHRVRLRENPPRNSRRRPRRWPWISLPCSG